MFHYALNSNYFGSLSYFTSFHLITVFIMFSIITGLVWEIFNMLDAKSKRLIDRMEEQEKALTAKQQRKKYKTRCKLEGQQSLRTIRSIISQHSHSKAEAISTDNYLEMSVVEEEKQIIPTDEEKIGRHLDSASLNKSSLQSESDKSLSKCGRRRGGVLAQLKGSFARHQTSSYNSIFSIRTMLGSLNLGAEADKDLANTDWHKQMKSQYILNQTLLKNASRTKIKQMENNYLEEKFATYQDITEKILNEWKNSNQEDYRRVTLQGSLILVTLR